MISSSINSQHVNAKRDVELLLREEAEGGGEILAPNNTAHVYANAIAYTNPTNPLFRPYYPPVDCKW